jgi:hypothetical protein
VGYQGSRTIEQLNALFHACFRIQREASEAAGRYIPLIVENVKGAQLWVGPAQAHFGSFYLWGDVGQVGNRVMVLNGQLRGAGLRSQSRGRKVSGQNWRETHKAGKVSPNWSMQGLKGPETEWRANGCRAGNRMVATDELAGSKGGGGWFGAGNDCSLMRQHSFRSAKRKAASAQIAKIPFPLAQYIAKCFLPENFRQEATA